MAKKNHYYVLVLSDNGAVFVTATKPKFVAEHDMLKPPMEFASKEIADDVSMGLTLNLRPAYTVAVPYRIEAQPFLYSRGEFVWTRKQTIATLCYDLYIADWERRISAERQMDALKNAYESGQYLMDYLEESGYDGECFVCFDEFRNAEFKNEEYIKGLLDNDKLYEEYLNFRKESEVTKK